jgi:hypothetical protein
LLELREAQSLHRPSPRNPNSHYRGEFGGQAQSPEAVPSGASQCGGGAAGGRATVPAASGAGWPVRWSAAGSSLSISPLIVAWSGNWRFGDLDQ